MPKMLLSINPCHIEKICNGSKKFEYRKFRCKPDVKKIVIYSTTPVKQIIGEVDITEIIVDDIDAVWNYTHEFSGIDRLYYYEYFKGKSFAVAYGITNLKIYPKGINVSEISNLHVPQSFCYLSEKQENEIESILK